jgi:mono/diheme cytochrome c family protein
MRGNLARSVCCLLTLMISAAVVLLPHAALAQQKLSASKGKGIFTKYCTGCHGVDGKGNGPYANLLAEKPANLTQINKRNHGKFPTQRVARVIDGRQGYLDIAGNIQVPAHGPRDMPIWGERFAEPEEQAVGPPAGSWIVPPARESVLTY